MTILLPQSPEWDYYRYEPPHPASKSNFKYAQLLCGDVPLRRGNWRTFLEVNLTAKGWGWARGWKRLARRVCGDRFASSAITTRTRWCSEGHGVAAAWELAPEANLLTQELQEQGSHREPQCSNSRAPPSEGLGGPSVSISNVMSGDTDTVGPGAHVENGHPSGRRRWMEASVLLLLFLKRQVEKDGPC